MKNVLLILQENERSAKAIETAIRICTSNRSAIKVFFTDSSTSSAMELTPASNKHLLYTMCEDAKITVLQLNEDEISLQQVLEQDNSLELAIAGSTEAVNLPDAPGCLRNAKCPVYVISAGSGKIENIVLSYDGSYSSINAIKQYTRLFPEMLNLPIHFVQISSEDSDEYTRQKNISTWLPYPFRNADYKVLKDETGSELSRFIRSIPDCLTVIGSRWNRQHSHFAF